MSRVIYEKAGLPSASQYDKVWENPDTRICVSAKVTEEAKKEGVYHYNEYSGNGMFFLSYACPVSSYSLSYGLEDGARWWDFNYSRHVGLRIALQLIYNPKSTMIKTCQEKKVKTKICDYGEPEWTSGGKYKELEGTKCIVKFGGHDYVWLNKKECKSGKTLVMELWNDELEEKAVPFDIEGIHNDYGKAEELRAQCTKYAFSKCTPEELAYVVTVKREKYDEYETSTPVLNPEAQLKAIQAFDEYKNSNKTQEGITSLFAELDKVKRAELERLKMEYASDEYRSAVSFILGETCSYLMKHFEKEIKTDKIKEKQ